MSKFRDMQEQGTFHAGREYERDILTKRIKELEAENKKMKELKCPPIESGDTCICPIEELETMLIKKDERIKELKELLIEYGRHQLGCEKQWGSKYPCRCGWDRERKDK